MPDRSLCQLQLFLRHIVLRLLQDFLAQGGQSFGTQVLCKHRCFAQLGKGRFQYQLRQARQHSLQIRVITTPPALCRGQLQTVSGQALA